MQKIIVRTGLLSLLITAQLLYAQDLAAPASASRPGASAPQLATPAAIGQPSAFTPQLGTPVPVPNPNYAPTPAQLGRTPNTAVVLRGILASSKPTGDGVAPIWFSEPKSGTIDETSEDLNVMSFILEQNLEKALSEDSTDFRMGIPMLLKSGSRSVSSTYLEGFGALFKVQVRFPLIAPPAQEKKEETQKGDSDWERAKRSLYGGPADGAPDRSSVRWGGPDAVEFDAKRVEMLSDVLIQALKNGANLRHVKSDEWIAVAAIGTPTPSNNMQRSIQYTQSAGQPRQTSNRSNAPIQEMQLPRPVDAPSDRETVMAIRVRKADAAEFANGTIPLDDFRKRVSTSTYWGEYADSHSGFSGYSGYQTR